MQKFNWDLTVGGKTFTIEMGENEDKSLWVGDVTLNEQDVPVGSVIDTIADSFSMSEEVAGLWFMDALTTRLELQRTQQSQLPTYRVGVPISVQARSEDEALELVARTINTAQALDQKHWTVEEV